MQVTSRTLTVHSRATDSQQPSDSTSPDPLVDQSPFVPDSLIDVGKMFPRNSNVPLSVFRNRPRPPSPPKSPQSPLATPQKSPVRQAAEAIANAAQEEYLAGLGSDPDPDEGLEASV